MAGMLPVRRFEADLGALRKAEKVLKGGGVLAMFPEGTRGGTKGLQAAEPGTALLALRTGAPVQPMAIWGTEHVKLPRDLFRRTRAYVRFGKPFVLKAQGKRVTRDEIAKGSETIMREIAALLPEKHRGIWASGVASSQEQVSRSDEEQVVSG
jgi:1-acyl-sn-glycerol-3-phosphate acyltransferase